MGLLGEESNMWPIKGTTPRIDTILLCAALLGPVGPGLAQFTQQAKLVGTGAVGNAFQGNVALSADGSIAIVGGPFDNGGAGAAWVFIRSGGTWIQQAKLVGTGAGGSLPARQ